MPTTTSSREIKLPTVRIPGRGGLYRRAILREHGGDVELFVTPPTPEKNIPFLAFCDTTLEELQQLLETSGDE